MSKVWFITGSSRGLGRKLTEVALAHGDKVVATARKVEMLEDLVAKYPATIYPLSLDVTDLNQIKNVVVAAVSKFEGIDVLVNNAGFGITGATEAFTEEQVRSQLETNLYAPIAITREILPLMRKQRSGRILQISSIGGRMGNAGISIYHAAKFGVSGFAESLAQEVAPLGIAVTSVEPGGFKTDWAGNSMGYAPHVEGYETTVDKRVSNFKSGSFVPVGDPGKAAQVLFDIAYSDEPPVHLVLGSEAIAFLKQVDKNRKEEMEKWLSISLSTDHDEASNFLDTDTAKLIMKNK